jgi:hypothetical protein
MANYIVAADISDKVISAFSATLTTPWDYLTEGDNELNDLAQTLGVDADDIEITPLHYKAKRFVIAFVCMRVCQDKAGVNAIDEANDKYYAKFEMYRKEVAQLRTEITAGMLTDEEPGEIDRGGVGTGILLRG